jgi:uncharacterized protein (DUF934 family)
MKRTMLLIAAPGQQPCSNAGLDVQTTESLGDATVLQLSNDADPRSSQLAGVERVELHFPKFSDGRAYSQAAILRRRMGYAGDIRATGDVLADQVVQMQRLGFTSAVLRADQKLDVAQRQFEQFSAYYQGDAESPAPLFVRSAVAAGATP